MSGRIGRTGFTADDGNIFRCIEVTFQKTVGIIHRKLFCLAVLVVEGCLIRSHMNDFIKRIIFDSFIENQVKVICGGKMIVIRKSMGIGKAGVSRPKPHSLFVHHFHKMIHTSANIFRNQHSCIIGRIH